MVFIKFLILTTTILNICSLLCPLSAIPNLFGTRDLFHGRQFSPWTGLKGWFGDDSRALHLFLLLLHRSTSDRQALDPRGWGPLPEVILGVLRTRSQWGGQILESEGLAPWPSLCSLYWLSDFREKLLILPGLGGGCHHPLSQGRELQLGEGGRCTQGAQPRAWILG